MSPTVIAIIQARMGSSRFPGKSLSEIDGRPILSIMMEQLSYCRMLEEVIIAIPESGQDDPLFAFANNQGWQVFRGSEDDVLDRFYKAAVARRANPRTGIVRLTGDDILPDPHLVDAVCHLYAAFAGSVDYISTDRANRLPYGAAVELISFEALAAAHGEAVEQHDREHVVPFVKWNPDRFRILELTTSEDLSSELSLSIDTPEDLERAGRLVRVLHERGSPPFHIADILAAAPEVHGEIVMDGTS